MSGVFISYASEDRDKAELLAHALERYGWPVWWDRRIPFGKSFDEVIEENLAEARCVLVLWTKVSVESRWVRSEASEAAAREVLIPLLFEPDVKIPLEFRLLQAVNLCDWRPDATHRDFDALVAQIASMLGDAALAETPPAADSTQAEDRREETAPSRQASRREQAVLNRGRASASTNRLRVVIVYILLPGVLVIIAGFGLASWRVPTPMQIDVAVDRLSFTLAGADAVDLPERALNFRSITVENFDRTIFVPRELAVGARDGSGKVRYQPVTTDRPNPLEIVLSGDAQTRPIVTIDAPATGAGAAGRLEAISIKPGTKVTLGTAAGEAPSFNARVEGQALEMNVLSMGELQVSAADVTVAGLPASARNADALSLRLKPSEANPYLRIQGARRSYVVSAALAQRDSILLVGRAPIAAIELLKQTADGRIESALISSGTISYPDRGRSESIALNAGDFVGLRNLQRASILYLRLSATQAAMDLRLEALAGEAEHAVGGIRRDLRRTALDAVVHRARWVVLIIVLGWTGSIALGVYRMKKG
jgi:hypothetical protein